ncbi:MAG: hypothetical protein K6D94_09930 [Clostridiales bacterium]|nr:hypothetical protein [Clostridiales bacterium]
MDEILNSYVDFHETLSARPDAEYRLFITADSNYALYINGVYRNGYQFTDFPDSYKVYEEYPISDYLKTGENDIRIAAYAQNESSFSYLKGKNGVMYVITENGVPVIKSGLNTRANKNPNYTSGPVTHISPQVSFTFDYNFTDADTEPGEVFVSRKFDLLYPRPVKKLVIKDPCGTTPVVYGSFIEKTDGHPGYRMQQAYLGFSERLRYDECKTENGVLLKKNEDTDGIYVVYDLGREEIGYCTVDITLPCDAEFLVGWGEHLDDMRIRTNCKVNNSCFAASFKGKKGRNTFLHPFKRVGGRYLALQIYAPEAEIHYAGITPTEYETAGDVKFHCADSLHNMIYEVAKRTMLMCLHERHEDSPLREQGLYGVDSRIQMICGYYAFHEFDMVKNSIRLMSMSIRDDNMLELCAPAFTDLCIPTFTCAFPIQTWEYLLYSGDYEFAGEMVPVAERICGEFLRRTDAKGMVPIFKSTDKYNYWNFYEWNTALDGRNDYTYALPLNAFISMAYQSLANIYSSLGDGKNAEKWNKAADELNKTCHKAFYNGEEGYYYTKILDTEDEHKVFFMSQLAGSLAICAGMCPESDLDRTLEVLVSNKELVPTTLSYTIYRYDAMMKRPEKYGRKVFEDIAESYGYMLRHNATTFWETILGGDDFIYAASMSHGWAGVPAYIYMRYAAGITPVAPGVFEKHPMPVEQTGLYELTVTE